MMNSWSQKEGISGFIYSSAAPFISVVQRCEFLVVVATGNLIGAISAWAGTNNSSYYDFSSNNNAAPLPQLQCICVAAWHVLQYNVSSVCSPYTELCTGKPTTALWNQQHHQVGNRKKMRQRKSPVIAVYHGYMLSYRQSMKNGRSRRGGLNHQYTRI